MTETPACNICGADAQWQCPVCKTSRYCGAECQKLAWEHEGHREQCGAQLIEKHHQGGSKSSHGQHHVYNKAKWEHMAKEGKWTDRQRRYFWYRASIAPK